MSWIDRLSELYELFAGLAVVVVVIAVISWLLSLSNSSDEPMDETLDQHRSRPQLQNKTQGRSGTAVAKAPEVAANPSAPTVEALFTAPGAGKPMQRAIRVSAVAGRGFAGDRYYLENGHWSGTDDCEVTLIAQEDLDQIEQQFGVEIQNGEHRRNIVIRNLPIENLAGKRFQIGSASFGYECPRPPCAYIQMVTEPGMTKALGRRAGICIRCIKSGEVREGDQITISHITLLGALKYRGRILLRRWQKRQHEHN